MLPYLEQMLGKSSEFFLLLFSVSLVAPGPIYNLAAAVGVVASGGSLLYGIAAWFAVMMPGLLMLHIVTPLWGALKTSYEPLNKAVVGLNAGAVGVLFAGTIQLSLATIGLQWSRIFAVLLGVALQAVWEVEPVVVVLAGVAAAAIHGVVAA